MNNIIILLTIFLFFGCKEKTKEKTQSKPEKIIQPINNVDTVENIDISESITCQTSNQKIYKGEIDGQVITLNYCLSDCGKGKEDDFFLKTESNPNYVCLYVLSKIGERNFLLIENDSIYEKSKTTSRINVKNENKKYWHIRRNNNSILGTEIKNKYIDEDLEGRGKNSIKLKRVWKPEKEDLLSED